MGIGGIRGVNNIAHLRNYGDTDNVVCSVDALALTTYPASLTFGDIVTNVDALALTTYQAFIDDAKYEDANDWFNGQWWLSPWWENLWWPATAVPTVDTPIGNRADIETEVYSYDVSFDTQGSSFLSVNSSVTPSMTGVSFTSQGNVGDVYTYRYSGTVPIGAATDSPYAVETQFITAGGSVIDSWTWTVADATIECSVDALTLTEYPATIFIQGVDANVDALTLTTYSARINAASIATNVHALTLTEYSAFISAGVIECAVDNLILTTYPGSISTGDELDIDGSKSLVISTNYQSKTLYCSPDSGWFTID